jgi:hypothetical protein
MADEAPTPHSDSQDTSQAISCSTLKVEPPPFMDEVRKVAREWRERTQRRLKKKSKKTKE